MKIVNIMNFVRDIDERMEGSREILFNTTREQLEMVNEFGFENTFLLQYDAICDEKYQKLFKETATDKTELGLWYEIVEPLALSCGISYESEYGWKWDWHIKPGFSMAYTPRERELLIDEAMRKFKEVFGFYPKTVASWLIDTHTINYLADNYDISAFAICRDQVNTDAYTLKGGYFNQGYYPSRNNMFTPAQTEDMRLCVPVLRLLGPCPIHNYEGTKYISDEFRDKFICATMEPIWKPGNTESCVDWFFKTYFENEDLGFSYCQMGQENSFGPELLNPLRMQLEKLSSLKNVEVKKMGDTGELFKSTFPDKTPATSVVALDNWENEDIQAVYYDCLKYTANLMRYNDRIFIRSLFLFDEYVKDIYLTDVCDTFDAVYENMPIINNLEWQKDEKYDCGLVIDENAKDFTAEKLSDGVLKVSWGDKAVIFDEDKITIFADKLTFYTGDTTADIKLCENALEYTYKNNNYSLEIEGGEVRVPDTDDIEIITENGKCMLYPKKGNR